MKIPLQVINLSYGDLAYVFYIKSVGRFILAKDKHHFITLDELTDIEENYWFDIVDNVSENDILDIKSIFNEVK